MTEDLERGLRAAGNALVACPLLVAGRIKEGGDVGVYDGDDVYGVDSAGGRESARWWYKVETADWRKDTFSISRS